MLDIENLGIHSPNKIYDLTSANTKVQTSKIKRENANYSFSKAPRAIGMGAKVRNDNRPGPCSYDFNNSNKLNTKKSVSTFGTSPRRVDINKFHSIGTGIGSMYMGQVYKI